MPALSRRLLAPMLIAAAIAAGAHAYSMAAPKAQGHQLMAGPICPAGTNWDDGIKACV
jgi:hypothetical protein